MGRTNISKAVLLLVAILAIASPLIGGCAPTAAPAPTKAPASDTKASAPAATEAPASTKPAAQAAPSSTGKLEELKVADAVSFAYAPLYWAIEKGYFKEQGIDLKLDTAVSAADVVAFLANGQLDMAGGGLSAGYFNAIARGLDVKIVSPMGILPPKHGSVMIVASNALYEKASTKTAAALKGKKVAINAPGGIIEYILTKALQKEGLDLKDVQTEVIAFPDMPAALASGKVDAIVAAEPSATKAVKMGAGKVLVDDIVPGKSTTVFLASPKLIAERPQVLKNFMVAWMRGVRDLQNGSDLYSPDKMAVWVKYTKLPAETIKAMVPFIWDPDLNIQRDIIEDQQKVHGDHGLLNYKQPVPVEKMIDDTFVKYAREKLGPWKKQ